LAHEHSHNDNTAEITGINNAFFIGIVLNLGYVLVQIVIGIKINSLSLLSDSGHNFLDVAGLALAMLAFRLSKSISTEKYTYGYKKASILISLLNAVVLLVSIGAIGYNAILRFQNPEPLPGKTVAIVAGIGIIINGFSAFLFFKEKAKDLNINSAFLHLASDALVSLGLLIGGIIIYYTHIYWIDPLMSVLICSIIIVSTLRLLKNSLKLSLDGVPENVDVQKVKEVILKTNGVKGFHHLHVWAISTTQNAMTGHLVVSDNTSNEELLTIKKGIREGLEQLNIHHTTLEIEPETLNCEEIKC
jgi:cobalt-zinc-cadmium efflux system protein